jgi:hypothetical protein
MALLNAAALKKLDDSQFAYIDSKGDRHLPIPDAEHVRDAMSRFDETEFESDAAKQKARAKILAAAKRFGIDVAKFSADHAPDDENTNPIKEVFSRFMDSLFGRDDETGEFTLDAEFGDTTADDGDTVIRPARLFRCGDYPDKHFSFDERDLQHAIATFQPAPLDLEHVPTVLDGKLGQVTRVYSEDGTTLMGDVQLPRWLDSVLEEGNRKVSCTWDRATKQLRKLALVRTPRVSDAALMAAFSAANPDADVTDFGRRRHNTPSGQYAVQNLHDEAVRHGAVCKPVAQMASRHEATAIQTVHDIAVEHGATCEPSAGSMADTAFSTPQTTDRSTNRMNIREWLAGKAKDEGVEIDDIEAAFSGTASEDVSELRKGIEAREAEIKALREKQERQDAEFTRLAGERRLAEAVSFAKGQVAAHRVTPAAAEKLALLADRISASDAAVTFGEGEKSTTALLQEFVESLPDLSVFTTEHIKADQVAALFSTSTTATNADDDKANEARVERMLAATPEGRAILAERKAAGAAK